MIDDENTYYDNENMDINPNQPVDMTMKLPAKSHIGKLEVRELNKISKTSWKNNG